MRLVHYNVTKQTDGTYSATCYEFPSLPPVTGTTIEDIITAADTAMQKQDPGDVIDIQLFYSWRLNT